MSTDRKFWSEIEPLLLREIVRSRQAQSKGDELLGDITPEVTTHVGYKVLYVPRPIKSRTRIDEKIRKLKDENPRLTPRAVVEQVADLAGGRLLVIGLADVERVFRLSSELMTLSKGCRLSGTPKIFSETAKSGGFRGLKQLTRVTLDDQTGFPYELQVLTLLQHAWDQLQHPIYELIRSQTGASITPETDNRFASLSDKFYELDREIDAMRREAIR